MQAGRERRRHLDDTAVSPGTPSTRTGVRPPSRPAARSRSRLRRTRVGAASSPADAELHRRVDRKASRRR
jgi:hypothetical protein